MNSSTPHSNQPKTLQTESTLPCATADAKHLVVRLHTRSQALFNEIIICAVNVFL